MAQTQQHKDSIINIRALSSQRALIDMAASSLNKNRSDFMLEIICREAENILLDKKMFFLDDKAYQKFSALLEEPVEMHSGLEELLKSKSPWEK